MSRGSLIYQVKSTLDPMLNRGLGRSKYRDKKRNGGKPLRNAIYSWSTYRRYLSAGCTFARWAKNAHGCRHLSETRAHVSEYLQMRIESGLSPRTLHTERSAFVKLFQCSYLDFDVDLPRRLRRDRRKNRPNPNQN